MIKMYDASSTSREQALFERLVACCVRAVAISGSLPNPRGTKVKVWGGALSIASASLPTAWKETNASHMEEPMLQSFLGGSTSLACPGLQG